MTTPWEEFKKNNGRTSANARPWHALSKKNYVDDSVSTERMSICDACPQLIKKTKQCKECGCFMLIKTKLIQASCPLGKW